jgi:hypothetical protein
MVEVTTRGTMLAAELPGRGVGVVVGRDVGVGVTKQRPAASFSALRISSTVMD